jgi:uncharacterized protein
MTQEFIYLIRPKRSNFIDTMTEDESKVMESHFVYLKSAVSSKRVVLAGPCTDGTFGIVVFKSSSLDDAQKFMKKDPAVHAEVMSAELHPFRISLLKGRD